MRPVTLGCLISALVAPPTHRLAAEILIAEDFELPDGPLTSSPETEWIRHSGLEGETQIVSGALELSRSRSEDSHRQWDAVLTAQTPALYYSFDLTMRRAPSTGGTYFAMLGATSSRARLFVYTHPEDPDDRYRLALSNSSGDRQMATSWPEPALMGEETRVVVRYDQGSGLSRMWVSPNAESDASIEASDETTAKTVDAMAWRQASGLGIASIDNLTVATQFSESLNGNSGAASIQLEAVDQEMGESDLNQGLLRVHDIDIGSEDDFVHLSLGGSATFGEDYTLEARNDDSDSFIAIEAQDDGEFRLQTENPTTELWIRVTPIDDALEESDESIVLRFTQRNGSEALATKEITLILSDNDQKESLWRETFPYPDGSALTPTSPNWTRHSGAEGETVVESGSLILSRSATEDLHRPFSETIQPDGPTESLFWRIIANVDERPSAGGGYAAHLNTASHRAGLFLKWDESAEPNGLRIGIAARTSNSDESVFWPKGFSLETALDIVVRYDVGTGQCALWVNQDPAIGQPVTTVDPTSPGAITSFAFRQGAGIGRIRVDSLTVGPSLESMGIAPPQGDLLRAEMDPVNGLISFWQTRRVDGSVEISSDLENWDPLPKSEAQSYPARIHIPEARLSAQRLFLRVTPQN